MKRPLRIAVDGRVLGQRGVGRYLANLLQALARERHSHRFLVWMGPNSRAGLLPKDPRFEARSLGASFPPLVEQLLVPRAARREGCDLLFYPDNTGAIRPGLPMALAMHDTMWRRPIREAIARPTLRQRLQDAYRKRVCPRAARAAAKVITISRHSADCIRAELGLGAPRVLVIPEAGDPFFNQPLAKAKAAALRRDLGLKAPYVLASGAADRRKNVDRLIEAFAQASLKEPRLAEAELVVTSLRPGEAVTTTYAATARRCGVEARVRYLGYVSDGQLKALYQGALCFAFPSLWEGFGLPLLEAMALGCPVLAAKAGALPEIGGDAAAWADPLSLSSLAAGLREACFGKGKAARLARGRARAGRFTWKACARGHLLAFESAAA